MPKRIMTLYIRAVIALLIVGALTFSHFTAYRKGAAHVRQEWSAAIATASSEARKLEQQRQRRADEAAKIAAEREGRIRADAVGAKRAADSLRDALDAARQYASQSRAAAERATGVATELLGECSRALVEVSEAADRADSEARELRSAWPK